MFDRYAVYFTPGGDLARVGAAWLGWDLSTGATVPHPDVPGIDVEAATRTPRKYGLHATIKPPFRLAEGRTAEGLAKDLEAFCSAQPPVTLEGLALSRLGRFLALLPEGDQTHLSALAAAVVREFDAYRAPAGSEELARRRKAGLSTAQEANLLAWGYPHVMDQFRFHITLSGALDPARLTAVENVLTPMLSGVLPRPFRVGSLTLAGEQSDGRFVEIHRYALTG
ncbi:MAG: DUF1045 domain-containing protein [Pseudomonadota bacterium]